MRKLNENERLVRLDDMPVNEEPCYLIVDANTADTSKVETLQADEVLICAGSIANAEQRQAAYERYLQCKAGAIPTHTSKRMSTPFYIKLSLSEIDLKTGMTEAELTACKEIGKELAEKVKQQEERKNVKENQNDTY